MEDEDIGELVMYSGNVCVRLYDDPKLALALLKTPGHGYFSTVGKVEHIAWSSEYDLIPVEKGVFKGHDLGKIITRERLRKVAEQMGSADSGSRVLPANSRVHWCRTCGPCKCFDKRKGVIL